MFGSIAGKRVTELYCINFVFNIVLYMVESYLYLYLHIYFCYIENLLQALNSHKYIYHLPNIKITNGISQRFWGLTLMYTSSYFSQLHLGLNTNAHIKFYMYSKYMWYEDIVCVFLPTIMTFAKLFKLNKTETCCLIKSNSWSEFSIFSWGMAIDFDKGQSLGLLWPTVKHTYDYR